MELKGKTLGLLGGGQLGLMMKPAADRMGLTLRVLDRANCPLAKRAHFHLDGATNDPTKTAILGNQSDLLTIEIENVDVPALKSVRESGVPVFPQPEVIETIQDKGTQKQFFELHDIPTAPFVLGSQTPTHYPIVQKLRRGGYDGKGVKFIHGPNDWGSRLPGDFLLEEAIDIHKEIAVLVARSTSRETAVYTPVEMVFHPELNLLDYLVCPAQISESVQTEARNLAINIAEKLDCVGLLAVEMFLTKNGKLLVNELAPRAHNSGHHTIEASRTSQFEQHLRAIFGLPLGSTEPTANCAVMSNLLGEPGHLGPTYFEGLTEAEHLPGVSVHSYEKEETRPGRKMGHFTILGSDTEECIARLKQVRKCLRVIQKK